MEPWRLVVEVTRETGEVAFNIGSMPVVILIGITEMMSELAEQHKQIAMNQGRQKIYVPVEPGLQGKDA